MAHFIEKVPQKDSDWIWLIILTKDSDRIWLLKKRIVQCFAGSLEIQLNIFEECPLKNIETTLTALILLVDMSPEPLFFLQ